MGGIDHFSYDVIYGCDLDEYCRRHGMTIDALIRQIEIDIEILEENFGRVLSKKLPYPESFLENVIHSTIQKKRKHLTRLNEWRRDNS